VSEYPPDGGTIREDAMRVGTVWVMTAALALGLGAGRAAAQEPGGDPGTAGSKPGFFGRLFGKKADPPKAAAPAPTKDKEAAKADESRPATVADEAAAVQAREKEIFFRRQQVCDKLKLIAADAGDEDLMRRAEQLHDRAWALYEKRTGAQAVLANGFHSDEETLSRHLGGSARADEAPVPPGLSLRSLEDHSGRTAARRDP
jgi:pyruvate/2-oxoglutarate dehydrogenase complex dihydrolipoamide acyltransferase (E2) component